MNNDTLRELTVYDKTSKQILGIESIDLVNQELELATGPEFCRRNFDDVIFRFWTGLYDKNGVKIFDGDIIKYPDGNNLIGFEDGSFVRYFIDSKEYTRINQKYMNDIEVIGSIYQNHKLIK